jgi:hypothetical protein
MGRAATGMMRGVGMRGAGMGVVATGVLRGAGMRGAGMGVVATGVLRGVGMRGAIGVGKDSRLLPFAIAQAHWSWLEYSYTPQTLPSP